MTREQAKKAAEELVSRMTVEERAGQLRFDAGAVERLGVPAYNWWSEALHGVARGGTAKSGKTAEVVSLGAGGDARSRQSREAI